MLKKLNRQTVITKDRHVRILQFGEGNFLRAFADWIVDVMNEKTDFDSDIQIIQPRAHSAHKGKIVNDQGGLYHVVTQGIRHGKAVEEIRMITCVREVINAYEDYAKFLRTAENPDMQFVISNTTEAGICFQENDINLSSVPETFPGKITSWLFHRFNFFHGKTSKGVIFLPCELLERNGDTLQETIIQYIDHWKLPDEFKQWVLQNCTFCNTLVDRIVPGFPKESIHDIEKQTGFDDKLVVMTEPFYIWVIEGNDKIKNAFPAQAAGLNVRFVENLAPYRTQKVRILNGAHTVMTPVAFLNGLRTVKEVMDDQVLSRFVHNTIEQEIIPTLNAPAEELKQFASDVSDRFSNPFIHHELSSIALNSISKFRVRVLPSLREYVALRKTLPPNIVHSLAALICFYRGQWNHQPTPVNDATEIVTFFKQAWETNNVPELVRIVLSNHNCWGADLNEVAGLTETVTLAIEAMLNQGRH